ncbi:unnamed protein product [Symbiodinium pilosum]|uniref:Uncharacterized protein n=1 Tax=Symbiodinium pilosum TaxID=2952 RepID=A0A812XNA7_SYMPI|nr:unnamed protein product [Symbiodinium pilosum]
MLVFLLFGVPRGQIWFTEAGSMTMYAYLLHAPFAQWPGAALSYLSRLDWHLFALPAAFEYAGFMVLACLMNLYFVGLVYVLTTRPVRSVFGVLIEPTWILRLLDHLSAPPQKEVE